MCNLSWLIRFGIITGIVSVGVMGIWNLEKQPQVVVSKECITNIESGDLIFRRTRTIEGETVLMLGGGIYSHVGVINVEDKGVFVIHVVPSSPSMVRKERLQKFVNDSVAFAVYRVQTSHEHRQRAALLAKAWVGRKPFDRDFNLRDDGRLYCTELVYNAYKNVGIDLVDGKYDTVLLPIVGKKEVIYPQTIIEAGHVEAICKSFVSKYRDCTNVWRVIMKKKIFPILMFAFFALFLASCSSDPVGTVKAFFKALDAGEVEEAVGYLSSSTLSTLGHDKWQSVLASAAQEMQNKGGLSSIRIVDKSVHGNMATVTVKLTYGDGSSETNTIHLLKEDGNWKIDMMH